MIVSKADVERILEAGDGGSRELLAEIVPVVRARSVRVFVRFSASAGAAGHELTDLVQEALAHLLANDAAAIRRWDPERGMSFHNWVGLIVERTLISLLRGARACVDETVDLVALEGVSLLDPLPRLESRSDLSQLCVRASTSLSAHNLAMFESLCIHQEDIGAAAISTGMKEQALYAARARLQRLARKLVDEPF